MLANSRMDEVSHIQFNPLFDMSLSRSDLNFEVEERTPKKPKKQWYGRAIVVYLILQTILNLFLLYKVFTVESFSCRSGFEKLIAAHTNLYEEPSKHSLEVLIQNNSQEAKTLRDLVSSLETQVNSVCQLEEIKHDLALLNTTTHSLQVQQSTIPVASVDVRLIPGRFRGRVEVRHNGVWGTICDDSFDNVDGMVICKMLGFSSAITTFTATPGSGKIWLDELRCHGTEEDIFDCPHAGVEFHNCHHMEDAGVHCI
ncbi:deleted in malignant brain tumors 1 protein [Cynoglossus semilaevis]|uniref:Deleted in malignant brain tumors 1 protein n=1 Tax=Cynoglossus semilaevis TaxID=244447 RepID=A0A3P8WXU2_CYNSE|nr:deleted in malignant brain tumors 1 protein [Cynoglossus semilaevis]